MQSIHGSGDPWMLQSYLGNAAYLVQTCPVYIEHRIACVLEELDTDGVVARAQRDVSEVGGRRLHAPAINDQLVVDPDTHAVVCRGIEAVGACIKPHLAREARTPEVIGNPVAWASLTPVEGDVLDLAGEDR